MLDVPADQGVSRVDRSAGAPTVAGLSCPNRRSDDVNQGSVGEEEAASSVVVIFIPGTKAYIRAQTPHFWGGQCPHFLTKVCGKVERCPITGPMRSLYYRPHCSPFLKKIFFLIVKIRKLFLLLKEKIFL